MRKGIVERIHAARKPSKLLLEYANSVAPSRKRMPPVVCASQSRFGSTSVAPMVRHEYRSINAWYKDSPAGAAYKRSALAAAETSDAVKPTTRAWRRQTVSRSAANQGAPVATPTTIILSGTHAAFAIIPLLVRRGCASQASVPPAV